MKKPRFLLVLVAVALAGLGGYLFITTLGAEAPQGNATRAETPAAPRVRAPAPPSPRTVAAPDDEPPAAPPEERPKEVFVDQLPPGDGTGIDAFPKAGTKPIKSGILVPEGFELPAGYVRHTQHTDDGDELPPILMFHPDHKLVDAAGRAVPLPADLIVPAELAPPGMPIHLLGKVPVRADLDEDNKPLPR